ncbi:GNAT family N-acetyltransferase [Halobacillus faecis]|uniref:N-acetyltransferase n=1 Tax=Halobacillus faecis TaxID=360184 RepID=A0A511WUT9_9BACI|nr:GNAT family N-acetyltransferase [Halobacillus faecis]GEN54915.1 N-acetyltransferase [Halobacillus faecis]
MNLSVQAMTKEYAEESLRWTYEPPYDFYNVELSEEALAERLDGSYRSVLDEEGALIGFFCTGESAKVPAGEKDGVYAEVAVDMGLGMHPSLTGQGHGHLFGKTVLAEILKENEGMPVRLSVATFNKRAIRLYENMGFVEQASFQTEACPFITMIKE